MNTLPTIHLREYCWPVSPKGSAYRPSKKRLFTSNCSLRIASVYSHYPSTFSSTLEFCITSGLRRWGEGTKIIGGGMHSLVYKVIMSTICGKFLRQFYSSMSWAPYPPKCEYIDSGKNYWWATSLLSNNCTTSALFMITKCMVAHLLSFHKSYQYVEESYSVRSPPGIATSEHSFLCIQINRWTWQWCVVRVD